MSLMHSDWPLKPLGFDQFTGVQSAVTRLDAPTGTSFVYLNAQGADIRWRDDGTAPDVNTGHLLKDGDDLWYTGDLRTIAFIGSDAVTATVLTAGYYRPHQASDGD
jgi:hypothetical protein